MISLPDYTRKLLYEHDCVVLPELGGFLAYFSHAFYSEQNSLYHAPQKRVAFNEALKLDDGLLVHYLTINEQLTRDEARERVRQFVDTIKQTIKEKGTYALEGIGTLENNAEGKLQFEPVALTNFYGESFGFTSLRVNALQPALPVEASESATDWTATDRSAEELPLELPRRRRSRVALYAAALLLVGVALVGGLTQLPSESLKSSLNPFELVTTAKGWWATRQAANAEKKEKPAPVVEAAVVPEKKAEAVKAPETTPIAVKATKEVTSRATPEEKTATSAATVGSLKSDDHIAYRVIAGGFSKLANARKLERKLQRYGYENATVLNPEPEAGKLIIVTAIGCASAVKAKAHLAAVSHLAGAQAYVNRQ